MALTLHEQIVLAAIEFIEANRADYEGYMEQIKDSNSMDTNPAYTEGFGKLMALTDKLTKEALGAGLQRTIDAIKRGDHSYLSKPTEDDEGDCG